MGYSYILTSEATKAPYSEAYQKYKDKYPIVQDLKTLGALIQVGKIEEVGICPYIEQLIASQMIDDAANLINNDYIHYNLYKIGKFIVCGYIEKGKEVFFSHIDAIKNSASAENDYFRPMKIFYAESGTGIPCSEAICVFRTKRYIRRLNG